MVAHVKERATCLLAAAMPFLVRFAALGLICPVINVVESAEARWFRWMTFPPGAAEKGWLSHRRRRRVRAIEARKDV